MTGLRVVVVDDEPLAREGLAEQLAALPGVTIAGVFADGPAAIAGLEEARADALFVDIRMPGMSGFELVESLDLDPMPAIVFVTAYDAFAIRAFEVNALDYLLKPASAERLAQSVERIRAQVKTRGDYKARLAAALDAIAPDRPRGVGRLIVREVGQVIVVATRDVDWIEGADYYARLHVGPKVYLLRESMSSLEQRLDPARFQRVHRSAIVNLTRVRSVEAALRGDGVVVLADGTRIKVTRARREELEQKLEGLHETG